VLILYPYTVFYFAVQLDDGLDIAERCSRVFLNNETNVSCARLKLSLHNYVSWIKQISVNKNSDNRSDRLLTESAHKNRGFIFIITLTEPIWVDVKTQVCWQKYDFLSYECLTAMSATNFRDRSKRETANACRYITENAENK
jgi:hypothetical protein